MTSPSNLPRKNHCRNSQSCIYVSEYTAFPPLGPFEGCRGASKEKEAA